MSWRDRKQPASFRGVAFFVDSADYGGGRRLQRNQYPKRDEPYNDDLGRKQREFPVEAFVIGTDYDVARDKLIDALEKAGPGLLIHPFYGPRNVEVDDFRVKDAISEGGVARFSITFVEANLQPAPTIRVATGLSVSLAASSALASLIADFGAAFKVLGLPGYVLSAATSLMTNVVSAMDSVLNRMPTVGADLTVLSNEIEIFSKQVSSRLTKPLDLATQLADTLRNLGDALDSPVDAFNAYKALFTHGEGYSPVPKTTPARKQQALNQDLIAALVRCLAAAHACRKVVDISFPSADDAIDVRSLLLGRLDTEAGRAADRGADDVYAALTDLRTAVARDIAQRAAALATLTSYMAAETSPSLYLAQLLYGDAGRADEIVGRNHVRHPGFVPGGVELEVVSV